MSKYEIFRRYVHCKGLEIKSEGFAETEQEAISRVKELEEGASTEITKMDDCAKNCNASLCPMKNQKPSFYYRISD